MKQADLDAVREASRRERAHASKFGYPLDCECGPCRRDRRTIAVHLPALLAFLDNALAQPRREHYDLG